MKNNAKIINLIKAVIIIAAGIAIVTGLSRLLLLKSEDGISQFQAFYKQPENSVDVIFAGSSKVYIDVSTGVLWENHGIAAFDLGGAEAPSWVSYYDLKEALKTQRPKVICYEVSVAAMYDMLTQADNWASDNNFAMKWNSNRIDQLRINSTEEEFYERLIPLNIMHTRYKELTENDFTNVNNSVNYKGFDPRETITDDEFEDMSSVTDTEPCTEKEEEYIRKIIQLGKEEGIPVLLFASPYMASEGEAQIINYVGEIARSEGADFIDFNKNYSDFGMDFALDMADSGHLNQTGNYKFSDYFGSILKDRYGVPDRRGDDNYRSWDTDALIHRNERIDSQIRQCETAAEILTLTDNSFLVFAINNDKAVIFENNNVVDSKMLNEEGNPPFRMSYENGKDAFVFTEKNDKGKRTVSLFINDREYENDFGNIIYVYDTVTREFVRALNF